MKFNSNEIEGIIPHRYPLLLVDKIVDGEEGKWAKGIKNVTRNEEFFNGHFSQRHVMPGVLIIEALAQVGAIALLSKDEHKGKIALFAGIQKARFYQPVVPGDTLLLECRLERIRGSIGYGTATAKVGEEVVAKANLTFALDG